MAKTRTRRQPNATKKKARDQRQKVATLSVQDVVEQIRRHWDEEREKRQHDVRSWQSRIPTLKSQRDAAQSRLTALDPELSEANLTAQLEPNNKDKTKKLIELNNEANQLRRALQSLDAAIELAEARQKEAAQRLQELPHDRALDGIKRLMPYREESAKRVHQVTDSELKTITDHLTICDSFWDFAQDLNQSPSGQAARLTHGRHQLFRYLIERLRPLYPNGPWPPRFGGQGRSSYEKPFHELESGFLRKWIRTHSSKDESPTEGGYK